jgi:hypothetical protein
MANRFILARVGYVEVLIETTPTAGTGLTGAFGRQPPKEGAEEVADVFSPAQATILQIRDGDLHRTAFWWPTTSGLWRLGNLVQNRHKSPICCRPDLWNWVLTRAVTRRRKVRYNSAIAPFPQLVQAGDSKGISGVPHGGVEIRSCPPRSWSYLQPKASARTVVRAVGSEVLKRPRKGPRLRWAAGTALTRP